MSADATRGRRGGSGLVLHLAPDFAATRTAVALGDRDGIDRLLRSARVVPGGRAPGHVVATGDWPVPIRVRAGRRGGWLGRALGDRYASPRRLEREWSTWRALAETGAPTPAPLFALGRRRGPFWRLWMATEERTGARNGIEWLRALHASPEHAGRGEVAAARALGQALRRVHDAGIVHGDLNLANVLFEAGEPAPGGAPRCLLIDFDRARRQPRVTPRARLRDLMRLVRSGEKQGVAPSRRALAAALGAYCAGDRDLRRALLAGAARERRRIARHRWLWSARRRAPWGRAAAGVVTAWLAVLGLAGCEPPTPPPGTDAEPVRARLLAVGDTGRLRPFPSLLEGQRAVARGMARDAARRPVDALVLLGDNFYTDGLTRAHLVDRLRANLVAPYCFLLRLDGPRSAEVESACDVPRAARRPARVFAVLGNHDLETEGSAALQRRVVPEFVPDWRMARGLAEAVRVADGLDLILFESEPRIHDREAVGAAVRDAILEAEGPWRILATHRPIATDDFGRPRLGGYPRFVLDGIQAAGRPVQLVLAAHHHNLQVFEVGEPTPSLQLGLGSGARAEPPLASADHPAARFGLMAHGFARIELVGHGRDARLVATLVRTPRWPVLDRFVPDRVVARYAVDVTGAVEALPVER